MKKMKNRKPLALEKTFLQLIQWNSEYDLPSPSGKTSFLFSQYLRRGIVSPGGKAVQGISPPASCFNLPEGPYTAKFNSPDG